MDACSSWLVASPFVPERFECQNRFLHSLKVMDVNAIVSNNPSLSLSLRERVFWHWHGVMT